MRGEIGKIEIEKFVKLEMIVHTCNPSYLGSEGSQFKRPTSHWRKLGVVACTCHHSCSVK
jgi:hypothetical protein